MTLGRERERKVKRERELEREEGKEREREGERLSSMKRLFQKRGNGKSENGNLVEFLRTVSNCRQ